MLLRWASSRSGEKVSPDRHEGLEVVEDEGLVGGEEESQAGPCKSSLKRI
jgi:hypothetical protein